MNILIIGNGGREHALAWKAAQSPRAARVFVAPGNAGTELEQNLTNVDINPDDVERLIDFARKNKVGLTIVGPEAPLVAGIVDEFTANSLSCFGPDREAARLEGSKSFSKEFMLRHKIPTAAFAAFTDLDKACAYLEEKCKFPAVVKADGLAAGKGVIIADNLNEALNTVRDMLSGNRFGRAGSKVVIEEFLTGEEASFIVMSDGVNILPMATSQDHKARDDGDKGPNTGGMGAYSPAPVVNNQVYTTVMETIIKPTIAGMKSDGNPFSGFLYAGLMISKSGSPKVLEYNVRFGDPETQPIMLRLKSDLVELCLAALNGRLNLAGIEWDQRASLGVVLAAGGYPANYGSGDVISSIPPETDEGKIFHSGTALANRQLVTAGGRVLCVCALADDIRQARAKAYDLVRQISWKNMYYRKDIGAKACER